MIPFIEFIVTFFDCVESSTGGGESREQTVARLTTEMLGKLPPVYDEFEVKDKLREMGLLNSMVIFLRQELDRMQRVRFSFETFNLILIDEN